MDALQRLHKKIDNCRLCAEFGLIERAVPVVAGRKENRMMLIGQAPGQVEQEFRRPFHGRAGRQLFRWLASIGIEEEDFRSRAYMTAITKCFPGRTENGSGDRCPSRREIELCRPFLEEQLRLIRPEVILTVGTLANERYFPGEPLAALIGQRFLREDVVLVPLPHPSGASRWLNRPENRALLQRGLKHVRSEWDRLMLTPTDEMPLDGRGVPPCRARS